MSKVLVIDDDRNLLLDIRQWLEAENYVVETATDGESALGLLQAYDYDVVVLDWELPKLSGIEILHKIRQARSMTPVLMLSGRGQLEDKERGLDTGADDYLSKPFQMRELSARLRSLLRRVSGLSENVLRTGNIVLDPKAKRVTGNEQEILLLPKEFALLEFFMRHPNQSFNQEQLLSRVWSSESEASTNTVKSFVYMLRKKLTAAGYPNLIRTAHGVGYSLVPPTQDSK